LTGFDDADCRKLFGFGKCYFAGTESIFLGKNSREGKDIVKKMYTELVFFQIESWKHAWKRERTTI